MRLRARQAIIPITPILPTLPETRPPATIANIAICLIHQTSGFLPPSLDFVAFRGTVPNLNL